MENNASKPWLHQWFEHIWYHNGRGKYLLAPLTAIFCLLSKIRRWQCERQRTEFADTPIIIVGNITVGGTGKTPMVVKLVELLKQAGYSPGIISRGYKGTAKKWPQSVTASTSTDLVGDEPVLLAARSNVPVVVGPDRNTDIRYIINKFACDVVISDDGMQHYKMPRDIEIAVIDGDRLFGNGWCLPAGPLRERISRLKDCKFRVLNGDGSNQSNDLITHSMQLQGNVLKNVSNDTTLALNELTETTVHAVTGIGNPDRFFKQLEKANIDVIPHGFADHHLFRKSDIVFGDDYPVIMTEKDAVKCRQFQTENCWYLPVEARLSNSFEQDLMTELKSIQSCNS